MSVLNVLLYIILSIYIHSPVYLINEFINGLLITPDPDTYLTTPQAITRHGYLAETHNIQTTDGFILALHRIPPGIKHKGENQYPVLLVHGVLESSASWAAQGPGHSLPFLMADLGYDIWMLNARGNVYSRSHANYTPMEHTFWDFSIHELGIYDLPTAIDFILDKTNHEKLFLIGHSSGTAEAYITLSVLPEYNKKIMAQVSLAPLYLGAPTVLGSFVLPSLKYALRYWNQNTRGSVGVQDLVVKLIIFVLTKTPPIGYNAYDLILYLSFRELPWHETRELRPKIYSHFPAGSSAKLTLHAFQLLKSFSNFDYGPTGNLEKYGTISPPEYNISKVVVPTRIYHSILDEASTNVGVSLLYNKLPVKAGLVIIPDPLFAHLDFLWNKNAKKLVYDDVISFINGVKGNSLSTT